MSFSFVLTLMISCSRLSDTQIWSILVLMFGFLLLVHVGYMLPLLKIACVSCNPLFLRVCMILYFPFVAIICYLSYFSMSAFISPITIMLKLQFCASFIKMM